MSIFATICNENMTALTDRFIVSHNVEFDAVEMQAKKIAAEGTKCCIRWFRDNDGQVAYWGPAGAIFQPHWYKRDG